MILMLIGYIHYVFEAVCYYYFNKNTLILTNSLYNASSFHVLVDLKFASCEAKKYKITCNNILIIQSVNANVSL